MDPPEHTRLRGAAARAFTAPRIEELRDRARRVADDLVDAMLGSGPPADLVRHFAAPLTLTVECELLGIAPPTDRRFAAWSQVVSTATLLSAAKIREYNGRLGVHMRRLVQEHRRRAGTGLLDTLIRAHDDRHRITEDEVIALGVMLLATGYENAATQVTNFVYTLLGDPDALACLRSEPDLVPTAVEELTRYVPITTFAEFPRYATEDVELDGGPVRAGEAVLVAISAANRDERVFADPERLDLRRHPNPHIGYSHGVHHCLGAPLARMELQVCLDTLIRRLPGLRLAVPEEEISWKTGLLIRGPKALPVTW
jgi:cytochrome P450